MQLPLLEIVICFDLFQYLFETYLKYRQCKKHYEKQIAPELTDIVDQKTFDSSQEYNRDKFHFSFVSNYVQTLEYLLFLYFNGYAWMYTLIELNIVKDDIWTPIVFCGILTVFQQFSSLPFSLYKTFVIEEKHGFNKQTLKIFIKDSIKMLVVTAVIGIPIMVLFLKIIQWTGDSFVFYTSTFILVVSLLLMILIPNFIAPLFYKFVDLEPGELRTKIEELAKQTNYPLRGIKVMDSSTRTGHSNAFLYGIWKFKKIVLFDTLIKENFTHGEILSVLCHEIGHWKYSHTL